MPDRHYFRGSYGAKDIIPLYRDAATSHPNLHPELLARLAATMNIEITANEWACYLYGVMAHPGYTQRFNDELASKDVRVPVSLVPELFLQAVELGKCLLFLHSYGERFINDFPRLTGAAKCKCAVQPGTTIDSFSYDPERQALFVGDGEFGPVSHGVWDFEVSGLKVLQSWLGYRMNNRAGKKTSPLDDLGLPEWTVELTSELLKLLWILESTLSLYPKQADLMAQILDGDLMLAEALSEVPPAFRKAPKSDDDQVELELE